LKPQTTRLGANTSGGVLIEVGFEPFILPDPTDSDGAQLAFGSPLEADFVPLFTTDPAKLQNSVFDFPTNPDEGYIDVSVYFAHAHNPVDITRMEFGSLIDGDILLTFTSRWLVSFEGAGFNDFDYQFSVKLSV
jgi:hypothetical protein